MDDARQSLELHDGTWLVVDDGDPPDENQTRQLRIWTRTPPPERERRSGSLPDVASGPVGTLAEYILAGLVGNGAYASFPHAVDYLRAQVQRARKTSITSATDLDKPLRAAAKSMLGRRPGHVAIVQAKRDQSGWWVVCRVDGEDYEVALDGSGEISLWTPATT